MTCSLQKRTISKTQKGFTLVELSVVLLLIALMAAMVFPAVRVFTVEGLKSDARNLMAFFRSIIAGSFTNAKLQRIKIDIEEEKISLEECKPVEEGVCEWEDTGRTFSTSIGVDITKVMAGSDEYTSGEILIPIYPGGRTIPILVTLKKGEDVLSVFYNPFSNEVMIYEGDTEVYVYEDG